MNLKFLLLSFSLLACWLMNTDLRAQCFTPHVSPVPENVYEICRQIIDSSNVADDPTEELAKEASESELRNLTNHPNPHIRYYSFNALILKKVKQHELFLILCKHLCDTVTLQLQYYDVIEIVRVGDEMLNVFRSNPNYVPNAIEYQKLDSLLFWVPGNGIEERKKVLEKIVPNEKNHKRLRTLVVKEKVNEALITLLKFDKSKDKKLVKKLLMQDPEPVLNAIHSYPLPDFKETLENYLTVNVQKEGEWQSWTTYYQAIEAYNDTFARRVMLLPLHGKISQELSSQSSDIFYALRNNRNPLFDSVKIRCLNYLDGLDTNELRIVMAIDYNTCLKIFKRRLTTEDHPYWQSETLAQMAYAITVSEKENAVNVLNKVIETGYSFSYIEFARRARTLYNQKTIEIFKKRFMSETDDMSLGYRIDGIIAFNNQQLYKEIEEQAFAFAQLEKFKNMNDLMDLLKLINPERAGK